MKCTAVIARDVDKEVMVIESFKFYLDVGCLHDFIDFAIFLSTYEFSVLIRELNLEANFMMESLFEEVSTAPEGRL